MYFVKEIYDSASAALSSIVAPASKNEILPLLNGNINDVHIGFSYKDDDDVLPVYDQQQPLYESDEAANHAFLNSYWLYMTNHYGRKPQFRSDLFCCMFPRFSVNPLHMLGKNNTKVNIWKPKEKVRRVLSVFATASQKTER